MNAKRLSIFSSLSLLLLLGGCPEKVSGESALKTPSEALSSVVKASRDGDVEAFKKGLSRDFVATVERYQELGSAKVELKGAFEWQIFMRSLAMTDPAPKEEIIKGNKAKVRAIHKDGTEGITDMVQEDGHWRLAVPPGMVKGLDHFGDVAKMALGEEVEQKPDLPTGGGGKADRVKNLGADASEAERLKAQALDAFDLGDVAGASLKLQEALSQSPGDEELTVALGRAHVQSGKGDEAVSLFEAHLAKVDDKAVRVRHYLGMAYMMADKPNEAAVQWQRVLDLDAAYGSKFRLDDRAAAALAIAGGAGAPGNPAHGSVVAPASQPADR
jgi:tetratricopeptide (TPR) repeat protein